jgi:bifunctional ADP-heptose synthase (sugar kinase/adenylyltransferase)
MNQSYTSLIEDFIDRSSKLNICIAGETIIDEFIYVEHQGTSMKSKCPALKLDGYPLRQEGGSKVISKHIEEFVNSVTLLTNENDEIVKTRYMERFSGRKHVEINKFDIDNFSQRKIIFKDYDCVVIADFGHKFCDSLILDNGFYLMCQTNSANYGFNRVSKWKNFKKKLVCIDKREASMQMNKRLDFTSNSDFRAIYEYEINSEKIIVTLGEHGAGLFDSSKVEKLTGFNTNVVDTIGAGDTFYIFSCIANEVGFKSNDILTIASLAAAISTTWLGNSEYVSKNKLLNYREYIS